MTRELQAILKQSPMPESKSAEKEAIYQAVLRWREAYADAQDTAVFKMSHFENANRLKADLWKLIEGKP